VVLTDPELRARFDAGDDPGIRMIRREGIRLRRVPVDTRLVSSLVVAGLGVVVDLVGSMMEDPDSSSILMAILEDGSIKCVLFIVFYVYLYLHGMALFDRARTSF
jgi:hypothetical protein